MKKFLVAMAFLMVIGGGIYFAGTHYVVNTSDGIKVYSKSQFTLTTTYVDMNNLSFLELRHHLDLVAVMTKEGDLHYVPGGQTLEKVAAIGESVVNAVNKFDSEYKISSSLSETGRIGIEKFNSANEKYDISGKVEKAGSYLQEKSSSFNNWLKSK